MQPKAIRTVMDGVIHPSDSIVRLCSLIHWNMHSLVRDRIKDMDVDRGQLPFLMVLSSNQGINQDDLARLLDIDKGTVARGLKKLESTGLVDRVREGRAYRLYLSPKAKSYMDEIEDVWNGSNDILANGMDADEVEEFRRLLLKAYDNSRKGDTDG